MTNTAAASAIKEGEVYGDWRRRLAAIRREILALPSDGLGRALHRQQVERAFKDLAAALKFAEPYAACPFHPANDSGCRACQGSRWVTKAVHDALPKELK